jgi:hemoglobin/transferrin/lactoferrin receptor protein
MRACLGATTAMSVVMAASAMPGHAQETTPLGRIVLGWGTEQVALDTPQAVTVIDQEEIERQQATTVGEFFDAAPGVQAIGSERVLGQTFNIRGWGEVPAGDEGRIVVLQDGATQYYEQYRMGSFFSDPNLFCNVEVLRGPASATLYGSAAIGGVIRFETCDADDLLTEGQDGQLRFSLGGETNGEGGNASVRYATRLNENVDLFFSLNYRQADDYEDGDGEVVPGSAFDALSGVASLTYNFSGSRSLRFIYERWDSDLDDTQYSQTGQAGFGTIDRHTKDTTFSVIFESAEAFGDLEVTLAYADTDVVQQDAASAGSILFEDADYGYSTLSLDARVTSDSSIFGIENNLTYGVTASRQERIAEAATSTFIPFHPEGTATRFAIFGQSEFDFGNGLTVVPGLRLEWVSNEPGADDPGSVFDSQETADLLAFSPKIAFTYAISEQWGLFGSLAQTQRTPTLDELYSTEITFGPSSPFSRLAPAAVDLAPETAQSVEFGFTYSSAAVLTPNDAFDARLTAFYSRVEDLIELNLIPNTSPAAATEPTYRNVDEAEIYGLEIEAAYVSDAWYGNLAISAIEGRNLTEDEVWSQLPQDSLHLTVGRRNEMTGVGFGWTMNAFADLDYEGARGSRAQNLFPGYATHDLFASYAPQEGPLEGFEFRFGVDNVFDRTYRNALDQENGRGRTARLTLARVWDF